MEIDGFEGLVGLTRGGRKIIGGDAVRRTDIFDSAQKLLNFLAKMRLRRNRDSVLELCSEDFVCAHKAMNTNNHDRPIGIAGATMRGW